MMACGALVCIRPEKRRLAAWAGWVRSVMLKSVVCACAIMCGGVPGAEGSEGVVWASSRRLCGDILLLRRMRGFFEQEASNAVADRFECCEDGRQVRG